MAPLQYVCLEQKIHWCYFFFYLSQTTKQEENKGNDVKFCYPYGEGWQQNQNSSET